MPLESNDALASCAMVEIDGSLNISVIPSRPIIVPRIMLCVVLHIKVPYGWVRTDDVLQVFGPGFSLTAEYMLAIFFS